MFQIFLNYYASIAISIFLAYVSYKITSNLCKIMKIGNAINKFPMDRKHWLYGHIQLIPGPNEAGLEFYRERLLRHPRMCAFWAGNWFLSNLSVYHPDTVKPLLKSSEPKPTNSGAYKYGKQWIGDGLLLSSGEKWSRNRKLLTNVFHFDMLKEYLNIENNSTDIFLDNLMIIAESGNNCEMFTKVSLLTFDIILRCAFSYETDVQKRGKGHPYLQAVNELQDLWMKRCFDMLPVFWYSLPSARRATNLTHPFHHFDFIYRFTKEYQKFKRIVAFVHDISEQIIKAKKETMKKNKTKDSMKIKKDFLDVLLTARDENGVGMTDKEIQEETDTFLFAGHDTTASAISWTLYELARNPRHQKMCQDEIDALLEGRLDDHLQWEDLRRLNYLTMCIKEALRNHCPIHIIERELHHPLSIDGLELPEGSIVSVHIYALHHNPTVWNDPMEYIPERFSQENISEYDHFAFVPFSAGPRNCIGQNFALDEIKLVVARTLRRFTLSADPDQRTLHKMGLVMKTENGMYMKLSKR